MKKLEAPGIADLLLEIGRRASLEGGNLYKAKAYVRAAESLRNTSRPLAEMIGAASYDRSGASAMPIRPSRRCAPSCQPGPHAQAEALLNWLQKQYPPGALLRAADVEHECYPMFLDQRGWWPQPWGSRKGIGKHLRGPPRVGKVSPYLEAEDGIKERARCYRLPLADSVVEAVDLAALNRAA